MTDCTPEIETMLVNDIFLPGGTLCSCFGACDVKEGIGYTPTLLREQYPVFFMCKIIPKPIQNIQNMLDLISWMQ